MKRNVFLSVVYAFALVLMLGGLSSCEQAGCTNPFSDNYDPEATTDDGSCILAREKFIAQYTVAESCPSGNYTFEMNLVAGSASDDAVIINNLGDFGAA
ncbi:MAG: hypothetical protein AAF804_08075, partial [Bacteroidota bacterium]